MKKTQVLFTVLLLTLGVMACGRTAAPEAEYPERWRNQILGLEEQLVLTPGDGGKMAELFRVLQTAGLADDGLARARAFVAAHPEQSAPVRFALANYYRTRSDWDNAEAQIGELGSLTGERMKMTLNLAILCEARGNYDRARQLADEAGSFDPLSPLPYYVGGDIGFRHGDLEAAQAAWHQAYQVAPKRIETVYRLAVLAAYSGNAAESKRWFNDIVESGGSHPLVVASHLALGQEMLERKVYSEAEHHFASAAELLPDRPEPHYYLAQLRMAEGKEFAALNELNNAILRDGDYAPAHELQGDILGRQPGMEDDALAKYRRVLALRGEAPNIRLKIAALLMKQGDAAAAREELGRIDDDDADLAEIVKFNVGVLAYFEKDWAAAVECFSAIPLDSPLHQRAQYNLSVVALARGDYATAIATGEEYMVARPQDVQVRNNIGVSYCERGDTDMGMAYLKEASELSNTSEILSNLQRMTAEHGNN